MKMFRSLQHPQASTHVSMQSEDGTYTLCSPSQFILAYHIDRYTHRVNEQHAISLFLSHSMVPRHSALGPDKERNKDSSNTLDLEAQTGWASYLGKLLRTRQRRNPSSSCCRQWVGTC